MIRRKKKRILISIIILLIIAIVAIGIVFVVNNNRDKKEENIETENISFKTKSLILKTENEIGDTYDAIYVEELMENMYVLEYETEEATKNAYEKLKKRKDIEYVNPNKEYKMNSITERIIAYENNNGDLVPFSWGATAMGLDILQQNIDLKSSVETVKIAVIDSGLDVEHDVITQLYADAISEKRYNAIDNGTDITDVNIKGHGTMMTGAILDGAPKNIEIIPVKVFDTEITTTMAILIKGINYAIEQNVDIINMSLGTEDNSGNANYTALEEAIQKAIDAGIIVVAATGNGGEDYIADNMDPIGFESYPAEIPDVIAVGAVKNGLIELDENRSNIK